jgi:hypothetical protein
LVSDRELSRHIRPLQGTQREQAIYYRPDGTPTRLLPADDISKVNYLKKGFTLEPPGKEQEVQEEGTVKCPFCDFTSKTEETLGMWSHMRTHITIEPEVTITASSEHIGETVSLGYTDGNTETLTIIPEEKSKPRKRKPKARKKVNKSKQGGQT